VVHVTIGPGVLQRYRCTGEVLGYRGAVIVQGYKATSQVHVCRGTGVIQGYNGCRSSTDVQQ